MKDVNKQNISENDFEQCIKCTICTVYCPVTIVNPLYPGPKQAGPDGERYRLKKPLFYDEALKYCLNCKRCEVACPSNVKIGDIIQSARIKYSKEPVKLRDQILANTDFMGGIATKLSPVVNFSLGLPPVKRVMDATLKIDRHRTFPKYASRTFESWMKKKAPDQSIYSKKVSFFHGCYVNYNYPQLGKDLVTLMNALGWGVELLEKERCCGVAKISNRLINAARKDAQHNIKSIRKAVNEKKQVVISTSSTCTFTIRDEYPHLLDVENGDVRDSINLATKFIFQLLENGKIKLAFKDDFKERVAYHTPCHMEKLGWEIYSTSLLKMIPGLTFVPLDSQCCGIAGTYGFKKENYKYSQAIGNPLFNQIEAAGVDVVATDCETCKWQLEMSVSVKVEHPISILVRALDIQKTTELNK